MVCFFVLCEVVQSCTPACVDTNSELTWKSEWPGDRYYVQQPKQCELAVSFFYHLIYITQYSCKNTRFVWQEGFWFKIAVSKIDPFIFLQENVLLESWILELRARKILGIVFSRTSIAFLIFCNNPVASGCEFMDHLPTVFEQTILPALGIIPQLTIWWDHDSITWPPHVVSVKHFIENWQDIRARTYCSMQPWILAGLQHLVSKLHLACKSQTNRTGWCHRKL